MTYNPRLAARDITPFGRFELHPSHLITGTINHSPAAQADAEAALRCVDRHALDQDDAGLLADILGLVR